MLLDFLHKSMSLGVAAELLFHNVFKKYQPLLPQHLLELPTFCCLNNSTNQSH